MTEFDDTNPPEKPSLTVVSDDERAHRQQMKKNRSVEGMEKRWADKDREALAEGIAANAPPVISEPRCQTCQSPNRLWIERQLIRGVAYAAIANSVPNGPDRRSISNHYKEHMDLEGAMVRAIMEEEADLLQQNYDEGVKGAFTNKAALGILIRKGYSDALDNITQVEPKDIIKMMELHDKLDTSSASRQVEEAKAAIAIFMEAIRNVFTDNLDREEADFLSESIVLEVKRLREQNELEAQIEDNMRQIPSAAKVNRNEPIIG